MAGFRSPPAEEAVGLVEAAATGELSGVLCVTAFLDTFPSHLVKDRYERGFFFAKVPP